MHFSVFYSDKSLFIQASYLLSLVISQLAWEFSNTVWMLGPLHIEQVLRWLPTFKETVDGRKYMTMPILTLLEELCFFVLFCFYQCFCLFFLFFVCIFFSFCLFCFFFVCLGFLFCFVCFYIFFVFSLLVLLILGWFCLFIYFMGFFYILFCLFGFFVFCFILFICLFIFTSSVDAGIKRPRYAYQLTLASLMTLANDAFSAQTGYSDVSTLKNGQKSLQQPNNGLP